MLTYEEIKKYPICDLLKALGQTIQKDIKQKGFHKKDLCRICGISTMTFYRLCNGENVSLDALFRVLKAIDRYDTLELLLTPLPPPPIDLYYKMKKTKRAKKLPKKTEESLPEEQVDDGEEWSL